jgi:hypothetical protein
MEAAAVDVFREAHGFAGADLYTEAAALADVLFYDDGDAALSSRHAC